MFELASETTAKLLDITVLSRKGRTPDEAPGAKLALEVTLGNAALTMFDGALKSALFRRDANTNTGAQHALDGVEPATDAPNLTGIGAHCKTLAWSLELTGYTLRFIYGTGRTESNIEVDECTLSAFRLMPREGGSVIVRFACESPNVSPAIFGKLATLKSCEVTMTLEPPVAQGDDLVAQASGKAAAAGDDSASDAGDTEPKRRGRARRLAAVE